MFFAVKSQSPILTNIKSLMLGDTQVTHAGLALN